MSFRLRLLFFLFVMSVLTARAQITVKAEHDTVGVNYVYEITVNHPINYSNNWENVHVTADFNGPQHIQINGFFFDSGVWKVRFAPPQIGTWSYVLNFVTPGNSYTAQGHFTVISSGQKGFLKQHPTNPFRLIYPDGTLFNGLGFEDCVLDYNGNGSPLDDFGFDGGFRSASYQGSRTTLDKYMHAYGAQGAGFNLFRWTTNNCSFGLYNTIATSGNTYLIKEGMFGDTLVRSLQANKIRIWLTFFGPPVFPEIDGTDPQQDAAIERYVDYVLARYGAYVDIWELFNESTASSHYYQVVAGHLKTVDPYHRLISVSDQRPELSVIDINSPHWYEKESELESDKRAWDMIMAQHSFKKPIIYGEQGNSVQCWDPLSALRMRIRAWTAFFAEGMFIFWNTAWAKDYQHPVAANIYLGPEERGYIRALNDFTTSVDSSVTRFVLTPANPGQVRGYGLYTTDHFYGYFHHFTSHVDSINTGFKFRMRRPGMIYWIDPATNSIRSAYHLDFGTQQITSPNFLTDLAMRIDLDRSNSPFDENKAFDIVVYPDPASTYIRINGNFNSVISLSLFDTSGKKVLTRGSVHNDEPINVAYLSTGTYVYVISDTSRRIAGKILIQH